jgi:hypothetical protein
MIYIEKYYDSWLIKSTENEDFIFGPFDSESDAHFVAQMFRMNKIQLVKDVDYGEENLEDTNTVY